MSGPVAAGGAPRGVIFDMDGVMVLTEDAHWRAWRAAGESRGVAIAHEVFLSCFGRVNADCVRVMFGAGVSSVEAERIAEEKERAFRDLVRADVPLAPGLRELLAELRGAGVRMAVGSSAPRANVDLILDAGGLRAFFRAAVDGSQVKRGKPAPDVFLLAAERLEVPAGSCVVVEDAPAGIEAAAAAGMRPIGITTTHRAEQLRSAGAAHIVERLRDVAELVLRGEPG
ncbi:MAG: HAD family phosphatase [Phycisphaerae bacterium]|nr:HAD family phosphatase [Phycisphaerae bacterium]